ncbi:MAG: type I glyceraldehyde-3-phosphate dehydrogenase [Pseudomonadota bacterium]
MTIKIAINGYGRIGRLITRALYEGGHRDAFEIVGINDLVPVETAAHLTRHDTVHGKFAGDVSVEKGTLIINGDRIPFLSERDPSKLPWKKLAVDVVHECTGLFCALDKASAHLIAGAKKVLISAPANDAHATIVYGVNHNTLKATDTVVSNASCTTNCLAPLVKVLLKGVGIEKGLMTTIHAYTSDQLLQDGPHKDLHRARAAALSMIPTKTGAAAAVGLVLPQMRGLLDGFAIRVPVANVSIVDLCFTARRETSVEEINKIMKAASVGELKDILIYNDEPLVSSDFNHNSASSIFDASLTKVVGNFVKVCAWYDNEWGFSNRMLDTTRAMMSV